QARSFWLCLWQSTASRLKALLQGGSAFGGALPAVDGGLAPTRDGEFVGRGVFRDHAAGADGRALADLHRGHQRTVGADEGTVADGGGGFVHAVVVAGDGAGADVHLRAHQRVADIAQV